MDFDKEHVKQWMLDHLWEYFPEKRIAYTEESLVILDEMFQDYVDEYYTPQTMVINRCIYRRRSTTRYSPTGKWSALSLVIISTRKGQ